MICLPSCHSTNAIALEMIAENTIIEGTVIITSFQQAGKGQYANTWEADEGKNLTFSIIYNPQFLSIKNQFYLTIAVSTAIALALQQLLTSLTVKIKWPNDIYINDTKVCGILIHNVIKKNIIQNTVIGIGINVNQESFTISKATSLKIQTQQEWSLDAVLCMVLEQIEAMYQKLRNEEHLFLQERYQSLLYRRNEKHFYKTQHGVLEGTITGVSPEGLLNVISNGTLQTFNNKEIEYLNN